MPVAKRWTKFTRDNVERLPNTAGAYELANSTKRIINIDGSNTSARARPISHLINNKYPTARYFRCDFEDFFH